MPQLPAFQPGQWAILVAIVVGAATSYVRIVAKRKRPIEAQIGWVAAAMAGGYAIPWTCHGVYLAWSLTPDLQLYVIVGCMCTFVLAVAAIVKANA